MDWQKLKQSPDEEVQCDQRFGHSACVIGTRVIIYGGCKILREMNKKSVSFKDLVVLDVEEMLKPIGDRELWSKPQLGKGIQPPKRRNHVACIVGQEMLIHGGVSELGKIMDSPWILDLRTFRWKEAKLLDKIDPDSIKRGFKHTQLFKINDDLTNGEEIDN